MWNSWPLCLNSASITLPSMDVTILLNSMSFLPARIAPLFVHIEGNPHWNLICSIVFSLFMLVSCNEIMSNLYDFSNVIVFVCLPLLFRPFMFSVAIFKFILRGILRDRLGDPASAWDWFLPLCWCKGQASIFPFCPSYHWLISFFYYWHVSLM